MTAAGEQPGGQGVRVPHVSRTQLVTAPRQDREGGDQVQHPSRVSDIRTLALWAGDSFGHIGDVAVPPPPNLVTEEPKSAQPWEANGALKYHASILVLVAPRWSHLDTKRSVPSVTSRAE
jgi:hypothetical protein